MPLANIHTMNIFEQIIQFFKDKRTEQGRPREIMLKELLSYARRGQYNEQFSDALRIVDEAALLAGEIGNPVHIADVMLHRVDILIAQGDHEEAARVLDELEKFCAGVGFKAPLAYTYIARGVLAQAQAEYELARHYFEQANPLAAEAGSTGAQGRIAGHLADLDLSEGNAAYAIHQFRQALPMLQSSGDSELIPYFVMRFADALRKTGQAQEGSAMLRSALHAATLLKQRGIMRATNLRLGKRLLATRNATVALPFLKAALDLAGENPDPDAEFADTLLHLGIAYLEQNRASEALIVLERAQAIAYMIDDSPQVETVRGWIGIAFYESGKVQEAQEYIDRALNQLDENPTSLNIRLSWIAAERYSRMQQHDMAENTLKRAITGAKRAKLTEERIESGLRLGDFYAAQQRDQDAFEVWSAALDDMPPVIYPELRALLLCRIGSVRYVTGYARHALKDYEGALETLTDDAAPTVRGEVLIQAAIAYSNHGDIASAEAFFRDAVALAEKQKDAVLTAKRKIEYGRFLAQIGDPKPALTALMEARNTLQEAGEDDAGLTAALYLGETYLRMGKVDLVLRYVNDILQHSQQNQRQRLAQCLKAEALIKNGDISGAEQQITLVLKAARENKDFRAAAYASVILGERFLQAGRVDDATTHAANALEAAEWINDRRLIARACLLQSRLLAQSDAQAAARKWDRARQLMTLLRIPIPEVDWL